MKNVFIIITLVTSLVSLSLNATEMPTNKKKQTTIGLYLSPQEAFDMKSKDENVVFIDVRTRAEVAFVGMPSIADANIPYVSVGDWDEWDEKKKTFKLIPNSGFLSSLDEVLENHKGNKASKIIVMCRSGGRSARAANLMAKAGYTNVYSIVEGFEGDKVKTGGKKGQRLVNGWKNANLPWSYKLDEEKMPQDM